MSGPIRSKSNTSKTSRRRADLRRAHPKRDRNLRDLLQRPEIINTVLVALGLAAATAAILAWGREQLKIDQNMIATDTRLVRKDFSIIDEEATLTRREEARRNASIVFVDNAEYRAEIAAALDGLPLAVAGKTSIEQEISQDLRQEFKLTPEALHELQAFVIEGDTDSRWLRWVKSFVDRELRTGPIIESQSYQTYVTTRNTEVLDAEGEPIGRIGEALELKPGEPGELRDHLVAMAERAGFPKALTDTVVSRIIRDPMPTIIEDRDATRQRAENAADAVKPVERHYAAGDVIYRRGDVLTHDQIELAKIEIEKARAASAWTQKWLPRTALFGLCLLISVIVAGYVSVFYPRITRNSLRFIGFAALMAAMLAASTFTVTKAPRVELFGSIAPTLLVAIILLLAYDQRIALFASAIQCVFVVLALDQGVGYMVLLFAACAIFIGQLREFRHRSTLMRAASITAVIIGLGALALGILEIPPVDGAWRQVSINVVWSSLGAFSVGFLVLGILPGIERAFDITTGMTLAELRDPKQPLLRQLQQKAAGTYNHSLQVANIAEAASEAIGADGLLVYVGALYHDIGKMNKPEYFIENQSDGFNKHEKLSPSMSLLLIVGHVKDGVELAREYGLPRNIMHFIESHHGTTLVEFFYAAAQSKAEEDDQKPVDEVTFRYPGPKPQTKEAAILMLSDAVESATRALAEPNPGRIEGLVRELARKRLLDGQFDECDLTFRELETISESIIKSMNAIYHGRISYPGKSSSELREHSSRPTTQISA